MLNTTTNILNTNLTLHELFLCINKELQSGHTLLSCKNLIDTYNNDDWKNYVKFDVQKYTRVIIPDMSNELFEFILICWDKYQQSPIHNHPENGCIVKILQGELTEDVYIQDMNTNTYTYKTSRINTLNKISYMQGNNTIHKISNTSSNDLDNCQTVSLHIYSPPNFKYMIVANHDIK